MGINRQVLKLLLHENSYCPLEGDFLSIGKQTVNVLKQDMLHIFSRFQSEAGICKLYEKKIFDRNTRQANRIEVETIYDHDLLHCISNETRYHCLDRSDYEGADIICDMNEPLPPDLKGKFDFIYNGSVMDNIFDPVSFIDNTSQMLKPGGRILHIECAGGTPGAYLMYSPEWFFSYYAINDFDDCKVYVTIAGEEGIQTNFFETDLYLWQPYYTRDPDYRIIDACRSIKGLMHVIVIAQKGEKSTHDRRPIQMQYLDERSEDWRKKYTDFQKNSRPVFVSEYRRTIDHLPYFSDHFIYLGSRF